MRTTRWLLTLAALFVVTGTSRASVPGLAGLLLPHLFGQDTPQAGGAEESEPPKQCRECCPFSSLVREGMNVCRSFMSQRATARECESCPQALTCDRLRVFLRTATGQCGSPCAEAKSCCAEAQACREAAAKACACGQGCGCCKAATARTAEVVRARPQVMASPQGVMTVRSVVMAAPPMAPMPAPVMVPLPHPGMVMPNPVPCAPPVAACPAALMPAEWKRLADNNGDLRGAIDQLERDLLHALQRKHGQSVMQVAHNAQQIHLVTPAYEAHCERLSCLGKSDRLLLEGNVRLTCRKDGRTMQVHASRVVINTKEESFFVESTGSMTLDAQSQFGTQRVVPTGATYYVPAQSAPAAGYTTPRE